MDTIITTKEAITEEVSINVLFSLLDDAIDDYENGNVISEDEMLAELGSLETED